MNLIKKQNVFGWITIVAAVFALIGMIVYIVTSTTGFMAGEEVNSLLIVFTLIAVLALIVAALMSDRLDDRVVGGILFVSVVLLAVSFCLFINARVQLFADVYFIPVNYPEGEGTALNISIVGYVFYVLALVGTIVAGFAEKIHN